MLFHTMVFKPNMAVGAYAEEYVYMLMLLVETLRRTGTYKPGRDQFVVMTDKPMLKSLKEARSLQNLTYVVMPPVATTFEGMKWKYLLHKVVKLSPGQQVCWIDVDHLSVRPFSLSLDPDSLAVYPEGKPDDTNYCGKPDTPLLLPAGFSAGFFCYSWGDRVRKFFEGILASMARQLPPYWYSLDQPHFNRAVEVAVAKGGPLHMLSPNMISFNGHNNTDTCVLISCAGEPGNGAFHMRKMLDLFMSLTRPNSHTRPEPLHTTSALVPAETHQLLA